MQVHRCQMLIQCSGTSGTNAPMKRRRAWRKQWPGRAILLRFGCTIILAKECICTKKQNWLFCEVFTITMEAKPMQVHRCHMLIQCSGTSGANAPMKRRRAWRRQWPGKSDFASFWLYYNTCQGMEMHQSAKLTLFPSINHYNRSKSDASSSQPDAYSMLWYLWYQCSDEAPACVEETVGREERFCFVLVVL